MTPRKLSTGRARPRTGTPPTLSGCSSPDSSSDSSAGGVAGGAPPKPASGEPAKPVDATPKPASSQSTPYLFYQFNKDIQQARGISAKDPSLAEMVDSLTKWWTDDPKRMLTAGKALDDFATTFQASIDRLYTAWGQ